MAARKNADVPHSLWHAGGSKGDSITFTICRPSLWVVQLGRKRASFTNEKAARACAGKRGTVRAYVEVRA